METLLEMLPSEAEQSNIVLTDAELKSEGLSRNEWETMLKKEWISNLLFKCDDLFLEHFINESSDKNLDMKIKVLEDRIAGKPVSEIPNYYECMDYYPKDEKILWDL